jgi:hypothetical protein
MTINTSFSEDIRFLLHGKGPLKKVHRIANRTFVVIDEALVGPLLINESSTWLEQYAVENAILMRIHRFDACLDKGKNNRKKGDSFDQ